MRLVQTLVAACCFVCSLHDHVVNGAFLTSSGARVNSNHHQARALQTRVAMSDAPMRDIVSRIQQQKQQLQEEMDPPAPKLFSDDLLEDMQQVLLLLETRVKNGPGTLSATQLQDFNTRTQRILVDMKNGGSQQSNQIVESKPAMSTPPSPPPAPAADASAPQQVKWSTILEDPKDFQEDYSPTGGSGSLAKGTANTYIIPGMDAMTPEEYQQALQQSIIDRQSRRKASGAYGNLAAQSYLTNLGTKAGMLK